MHPCMHAKIYVFIHAWIHASMHALMHVCIHECIHGRERKLDTPPRDRRGHDQVYVGHVFFDFLDQYVDLEASLETFRSIA